MFFKHFREEWDRVQVTEVNTLAIHVKDGVCGERAACHGTP